MSETKDIPPLVYYFICNEHPQNDLGTTKEVLGEEAMATLDTWMINNQWIYCVSLYVGHQTVKSGKFKLMVSEIEERLGVKVVGDIPPEFTNNLKN